MGAFRNIFRLTRPLNLLIVLITMLVIRFVVMSDLIDDTNIGMHFRLSHFEFLLVMVVALAATAAGNIINDYFDQKVDRINKPNEVIVGKSVKRRVAIILNQGLNALAMICTIWLSWRTSFWWPIIMPLVILTLLWWYSPVFKKQAIIGNVVVALCTASVPIWAAWYEAHELSAYYIDMMIEPSLFVQRLWKHILVISGFAFLLTMIREAVKDMEDLPGDLEGDYHTMPIVYGIDKTKTYTISLLFVFIGGILITSWMMNSLLKGGIVAALIVLPTLIAITKIRSAENPADFRRCSAWIKGIILTGLALTVWVYRF